MVSDGNTTGGSDGEVTSRFPKDVAHFDLMAVDAPRRLKAEKEIWLDGPTLEQLTESPDAANRAGSPFANLADMVNRSDHAGRV